MKFKPWLWLPPKLAHDLGPVGLKFFNQINKKSFNKNWSSFYFNTSENQKIFFPNPLGIAGGVDKNGQTLLDWQKLGCGFLEVGTITPNPQKANPGPIIDRNLKTQSLWNKMGFPSEGASVVSNQLSEIKSKIHVPLFINLGKNRTTPNEKASEDYSFLLNQFQNLGDAFVINISSPNTKGLREIIKSQNLDPFLKEIKKSQSTLKNKKPLIIKLSPDMSESELSETLKICLNNGIEGFNLTNTTLNRENTPFYSSEGGVSGLPLKNQSLKSLEIASKICSQEKVKKIIISTGGVMTEDDVFERIERGADLIQVYTTLVLNGPTFFRKVAQVAEQRKFESKNNKS